MIVDDAYCLQPGVHDRRTDELEAAALQLPGDLLGQRRRCGHDPAVALDGFAVGERPAEVVEALPRILHLAIDLGAANRRLDLRLRSDDPRVGHEPLDVSLAEARNLVRVEPGERAPEGLA